MPDIEQIIARFDPISLQEMDSVKLQDRVDTKYVFGMHQLPGVLRSMLDGYRLLHVEGNAGTNYRSLYFDTKDLQHYHDHHNRRTFRNKVRFREYIGSGLAYLEVKKKTGRGRTNKKRMKVAGIPDQLSPEQSAFIAKHCRRNDEMVPTIWNHFTRYTFVDRNGSERLTMDLDLRFTDAATDKELGGIVIAELKQGRSDRGSAFMNIMRTLGVRPMGMSKYCIGMLLVGRTRKYNGFKEVLLKLERLRRAA